MDTLEMNVIYKCQAAVLQWHALLAKFMTAEQRGLMFTIASLYLQQAALSQPYCTLFTKYYKHPVLLQ
jgi:hypothetical protein